MIKELREKVVRELHGIYVAGCIGRYGRLYIDGKKEEAIKKFDALLDRYPVNLDLLLTLAWLYLREGRLGESRTLCERALSIEPGEKRAVGFLKQICEKEAEHPNLLPPKEE